MREVAGYFIFLLMRPLCTVEYGGKSWGNCLHLHPESTKYSTASVNSRLLHVQLRIPVYNGAIPSYCSSVKPLGYDSLSFSSMSLFYHGPILL